MSRAAPRSGLELVRIREWATPARVSTLAIFIGLFLAFITRQTGVFQFDSQHYWDATRSLIGVVPTPDGYWKLRGVLTAVIFLPAAGLSTVVAPAHETLTVLLQNSVVFAAIGAVFLPKVVRVFATPTLAVRMAVAGLFWFCSANFAPYALVDVYAAVVVIAIVPLLIKKKWWALLLSGIGIGVAVNLRPAYLLVAILLSVVAALLHRKSGLLVIAGIAAALAPQFILNIAMFGTPSIFSIDSGSLAGLQASYASYTIRYDTMLGDANARQFYCSPDMASIVQSSPPSSIGGLAATLLSALPTSLLFSLQKVAASLLWPVSTPYSTPTAGIDTLHGVVVTVIAVVGLAAVLAAGYFQRKATTGSSWGPFLSVAAVAAGSTVTIVASASEARFALPLVIVGIIGVAVLAAPTLEAAGLGRKWIAITGAVLVATIVFGVTGLDHPAPRGEASASTCASPH